MKFYIVILALYCLQGQIKAQGESFEEIEDDDMEIIEALPEDSRESRQIFTLGGITPGLAAGATLLQSGLFQRETAQLNQPCITQEGDYGGCQPINMCHPERKIFQIEPKDTWIFGTYNACGYDSPGGKQYFGTCCTKNYPQVARKPTKPKKNLSQRKCSPMNTSHKCYYRNGQFYNSENLDAKIVGGFETKKHEYPFMAALMRVSSFSGTPRQFCGGSLIDESHVLTAAHCIEGLSANDVKTLRVYLGAHSIKSGPKSEHRIIRIIKHKDFDSRTLVNDIAILTLETPAKISGAVNVICLPDYVNSFVNRQVTVAGWGSKGEGKSQPKELYKVDVNVWSNSQCAAAYDHRIPGEIKDSMICAAAPGKDSCSGDSGGPLFSREQSRNVQVGIVSWGIGCARGDSPGVYTRVTKMMDWIKRIQKCY